MRELKFRAWDKYRNQIVWPLSDEGAFSDGSVSASTTHSKHHGQYDMPLMQFTGMKDSTGEDIYEGDILAYPDKKQGKAVEYKELFDNEQGYKIGMGYDIDPERVVIGNIYEDPESLYNG